MMTITFKLRRQLLSKLISISLLSMTASTLFIANANAATNSAIQPLNGVVAIVNDRVITSNQLDDQERIIKAQLSASKTPLPAEKVLRHQVLEHMIDQELQLQIAKNAGINIDDDTVDKTIAHIAQENNITVDQMKAQLSSGGMSYDLYRKMIHDQIVIQQLQQEEAGSSVVITPQEVNDMMRSVKLNDANGNANAAMTEYHIKDILITLPDTPTPDQIDQAKQHAVDLIKSLKQGQNFSQVAVAESQSQEALQGGDLGWRKLAELPDPFIPYVKSMQPGDVAGPIRTANGFHIIKLVEMQGPTQNMSGPHIITQSHVRTIFVKNNPLLTDDQMKESLSNIKDEILSGQDFAKVAQINSQGLSANNGGDMGWTAPGQLPEEVDATVAQLKLNQISDPIKTKDGWYLVQVIGQRKQTQTNQEYLADQVRNLIYKQKVSEAAQNWLQKWRAQSYVKIIGEDDSNVSNG